jgi:hypothetical protein
MHEGIIGCAFGNGEAVSLIPSRRIEDLREDIERFKSAEALNGFQLRRSTIVSTIACDVRSPAR